VDGLHQRAGNRAVLELHGNITRARCTKGCGVFTEWSDMPGGVPVCPNCGARLRPDVVWFGEMLPQKELDAAIEAAQKSQVFFSIGTSSVVQPAASLSLLAKQAGAMLVEVNPEATPLTRYADIFLQGKSGEILPELVRQAWAK
jgi:NAD-dependent deacetylase